MQSSFSELKYAAKKRMTWRDRFLAEIEAVTPWLSLTNVIAPHYPSSDGPGRPPVGLERDTADVYCAAVLRTLG